MILKLYSGELKFVWRKYLTFPAGSFAEEQTQFQCLDLAWYSILLLLLLKRKLFKREKCHAQIWRTSWSISVPLFDAAAQRFPPPFRFRLCRRPHYGGNCRRSETSRFEMMNPPCGACVFLGNRIRQTLAAQGRQPVVDKLPPAAFLRVCPKRCTMGPSDREGKIR